MLTTAWPYLNRAEEWPGRIRLKRHLLAQAWSEFLGRIPWEWFITLTFDPEQATPTGQRRADREAFWWCGQTSHLLRRSLGWAYAPERGRTVMWHVHALLVGGVTQTDLGAPRAIWKARNGFVDVCRVTAPYGAALYTTKQAALTGGVVLSDTLSNYRDRLNDLMVVPLFQPGDQE